MANTERELTIKLPESLVEILGGAQKATKEATRATVLDLVRTGKISVGKGAELLNLSRHDFLDLMNGHHVPAIDYSPENFEYELRGLREKYFTGLRLKTMPQ